jgi:hypothetical protein
MDGVTVNAEQFGGLSDRQIVLALLCALCAVLSHTGDTRPSGPGAKALKSQPSGSEQGQVSVGIQKFILRLAGYKILVGTGPSSRR